MPKGCWNAAKEKTKPIDGVTKEAPVDLPSAVAAQKRVIKSVLRGMDQSSPNVSNLKKISQPIYVPPKGSPDTRL